jgi:cystathionine gamma-synthase
MASALRKNSPRSKPGWPPEKNSWGFFCELPTNPLRHSPDIQRIFKTCRKYDVPVVDDTLSTAYNVDLLPWSDVIWTSLGKSFSGRGNVMGGR